MFLIILFSFSSCGIEVAQPIPRLFSPNGVMVSNVGPGKPSTIRVTWFGLNPETDFSGYNIYYTDSSVNALAYNGTKILSSNNNPIQATLPVRPFDTARPFTFDIRKDHHIGKPPLFSQGTTYWFYVRAYDQTRNLESPPSLFANVEFID